MAYSGVADAEEAISGPVRVHAYACRHTRTHLSVRGDERFLEQHQVLESVFSKSGATSVCGRLQLVLWNGRYAESLALLKDN